MADINKAMAAIVQDRKVLVVRSKGKDFFIGPGGKMESDETPRQALVRELQEEVQIDVDESTLEELGVFEAQAAGYGDKTVCAHVFLVRTWQGTIAPANEIEEIRWISSDLPSGMGLGSIFQHDVLPTLKARDLID